MNLNKYLNISFSTWLPRLSVMTALALAFSACKEEGTITVTEPLRISESSVVSPGTYRAELDASNKKKFNLFIYNKAGSDDSLKLSFWLPPGVSLPTGNGQLKLTPAQDKQTFAVSVGVATNVDVGPEVSSTQQCTFLVTREVCEGRWVEDTQFAHSDNLDSRRENDIKDRPGHQERRCRVEQVPYTGFQFVQFHVVDTTTGKQIQVIDASTQKAIATFSDATSTVSTIYDMMGPCQ